MKVSQGDYFVAIHQNKKFLAKALATSTGDVDAVLEKNCHVQKLRLTATIPQKDLVLNLGQEPSPGKVYGLDVSNLYRGRKAHDDVGVINFFYRPEKQVTKDLWLAFTKVSKILERRGLGFLLNELVWEILPFHNEKFAGRYIKSKGDDKPSRIQIRPEIMPATEYVYVILHELGHHLHLSFATGKKLNAKWLKLFNTSIRPVNIKKETSQDLLTELLSQEDLPSDFKGQLDEERTLAFKWIVKTIGSINAVTLHDLDTLFEAEEKDEIKKLWPVRSIARKELAPVVSEYATKNYRELIAESFAFVLTSKKLPDPIVKLVERTVSYAKANQG